MTIAMSVAFLPLRVVELLHRPDRVLVQQRPPSRAAPASSSCRRRGGCWSRRTSSSSSRIRSILADGELSASIRSAMRGWLVDHAPVLARGQAREPPGERLAAAQRLELGLAERQRLGQGPGLASQRDRAVVARQAVEVGAVEAGEALEPVERAGRVEGLGVQLERAAARCSSRRSRVACSFSVRGMRRAVGAEEERRAAARSPPRPAPRGAPRA